MDRENHEQHTQAVLAGGAPGALGAVARGNVRTAVLAQRQRQRPAAAIVGLAGVDWHTVLAVIGWRAMTDETAARAEGWAGEGARGVVTTSTVVGQTVVDRLAILAVTASG